MASSELQGGRDRVVEQVGRDRRVGCLRAEKAADRADDGRRAAPVEPLAQTRPAPRQPAADGADRPAEPLGRLLVGEALQVAQEDRRACPSGSRLIS